MSDIRICPICGKEVERNDMQYTRDCHGITYRLVCIDCYDEIMDEKATMASIIQNLMNVLMNIIDRKDKYYG